MAFRVDFGSLRPAKRLANGQLRVDGLLTRTGVFEYRNQDGTIRREYRPAEEVFNTDSLESFALVPVTDDHPPEMVTAENAKQYAVGTVGEKLRRDGDHVLAPLMVYDAGTILKMEAGKVQLSCGYEVEVVEESGVTPSGERYDAVQRNIRGNHVALVDVARAGAQAKVRMDAYVMIVDIPSQEKNDGDFRMDELKKELSSALAQVAKLEARADSAEAEVAAEKARADKAEAERDGLQAELTSEKQARQDAADSFGDKVRARVSLETAAKDILGDLDVAPLSDREIKIAVVKKIDNADVQEEKSDDYVTARFDSAIERAQRAESSRTQTRVATEETRNDASVDSEVTARAKMIEANRNAWKAEK